MINNFIKGNLKIILTIVITAIICISGTVFATGYLAKDVSYTKEGLDVKNVEEALNELYGKNTNDIAYKTFESDVISTSSAGTFYTTTVSIPEGKTKIYIYTSSESTYSVIEPTISSTIIEENKIKEFSSKGIPAAISSNYWTYIIETNGQEGNITLKYNCGGFGNHFARGIVFYK